jgi:hypothetical protein
VAARLEVGVAAFLFLREPGIGLRRLERGACRIEVELRVLGIE